MSDRSETVVVGGGQAGLVGQPRADGGRRATRGARAGPGRPDAGAGAGTASASSRRTGASSCPATPTTATTRRLHAARRDRGLPGALRGGGRGAGARGRGGHARCGRAPTAASLLETSAGEIAARNVVLSTGAYQRPHRPAGRGDAPGRPAPDRRRGLPQPGGAARRRGARGGQRPVGLPDRRGAAPGRPRRVPGLRPRAAGRRAGSAGATSSGGCARPATSTTASRTLPEPGGAAGANVQASGHGGGHDLHYRTLHAHGRDAAGALPRRRRPATPASRRTSPTAWPGATSGTPRSWTASGSTRPSAGLPEPEIAAPEPIDAEPPERLDLERPGRGRVRRRLPARLRVLGRLPRRVRRAAASRSTDEGASTVVPGSTSWASTSCASGSRRS